MELHIMFTAEHFLWIGLCAVFIVLLTYISKRKNSPLRISGYIMSSICAVSEVSKIMTNMVESPDSGRFLNPRALPLHLCSLLIFAVLFITFGKDGTRKQTVINFTAVAGTIGSVCAILIPTNGTDFTKLPAYQCFVYHAGLLWFSLYLIISRKANLGRKAFGRNLILLLSLVVAMLYANSFLSAYNTNFMYLVRPPMENLPFLTLNYGWYVYFLHLVTLGILIVTLFHLPFLLAERKSAAKEKSPAVQQSHCGVGTCSSVIEPAASGRQSIK